MCRSPGTVPSFHSSVLLYPRPTNSSDNEIVLCTEVSIHKRIGMLAFSSKLLPENCSLGVEGTWGATESRSAGPETHHPFISFLGSAGLAGKRIFTINNRRQSQRVTFPKCVWNAFCLIQTFFLNDVIINRTNQDTVMLYLQSDSNEMYLLVPLSYRVVLWTLTLSYK
jgi:hypothetical protein